MLTVYNFSSEIARLRKDKKYQEVLSYFKENKTNFTTEQIGNNEYIICDMLTCLRHAGHIEAAFKFLHTYNIFISEQTSEKILTSYSWLLYDKYKTENKAADSEHDHFSLDTVEEEITESFDFNKSDLLKKIEEAIQFLFRFSSEYSLNVLEFLFKIVVKVEKHKQNPSWSFVVEFCDRVDPEKLSTNCSTIQITQRGQLKDMVMASAREEWYAYLSKALYQTGQYERCFEVSKKALEKITEFHYGYDVWFARRIALCKKAMGNIDEAVLELEAILRKKKDWFIRKELAEMYFEQGKLDKAYQQAMQGMASYGDLEYKIELIELLGKMLKQKNELLLSYQHFTLARLIREENQWRVSDDLQKTIEEFKEMPTYSLTDKSNLLSMLTKFWNKEEKQKSPHNNTPIKRNYSGISHTGLVKKILAPKEEGKQGFITNDAGGDVFFFLKKDHKLHDLIKEGMRLEFETEPDKNGKGDRAIKIKAI